jgi:hypothetical protein
MAGSTRGTIRLPKFVTDPEYQAHVEANTPERFNPPALDNTRNPFLDENGQRYPGAPG